MSDMDGGSLLRSPLFGLIVGVALGTLLALALTDQSVANAVTGAVIGGLCAFVALVLMQRARR